MQLAGPVAHTLTGTIPQFTRRRHAAMADGITAP